MPPNTLTPRERAEDLWGALYEADPTMVSCDAVTKVIAAAITEAEDAKLEEAAAQCDEFAAHCEHVGAAKAKSRTGRDKARASARAFVQAAANARCLISKKDTP